MTTTANARPPETPADPLAGFLSRTNGEAGTIAAACPEWMEAPDRPPPPPPPPPPPDRTIGRGAPPRHPEFNAVERSINCEYQPHRAGTAEYCSFRYIWLATRHPGNSRFW